jgi:hypothetical protein
MREPLTINREIAERDGIDVDRLVTFYRQRNITVVESGVKRTRTEKTCVRCQRMLPLEKFPRTAIHRLADGRTFPGQRARECEDCYDAAREDAAAKHAARKQA